MSVGLFVEHQHRILNLEEKYLGYVLVKVYDVVHTELDVILIKKIAKLSLPNCSK